MHQPAFSLARYSVALPGPTDFDGWRAAARRLALAGVPASEIDWQIDGEALTKVPPDPPAGSELRIPRAFIETAKAAILHADPQRFAFLYKVLMRFAIEPNLMHIASDPDICRLREMEKAVRRDVHKMRAFVRFRQAEDGRYFAWFEPSHYIAERNAAFFMRRFTGMRWSILTPYCGVHWDGETLSFGHGGDKRDVPADGAAEDLWRTYYRNIFNPARLKVKAMQAEMPKKYWSNLPEASLIPDLIAGAGRSAKQMIEGMPTMAAAHHGAIQARYWSKAAEQQQPADDLAAETLVSLRDSAGACRRCPLWRDATQTVFGAGPENARIVFVGEQPGDQEDITGAPFVGPAGRILDAALEHVGLDRRETYVTNAVKHFKFEPRGKRRIHARPNAGEVSACRWWLDRELSLIKPDLVVALGATAAQALLGRPVAITAMRGEIVERSDGIRVFLTIHPSFILRIRDAEAAHVERERFLVDMGKVKRLIVK